MTAPADLPGPQTNVLGNVHTLMTASLINIRLGELLTDCALDTDEAQRQRRLYVTSQSDEEAAAYLTAHHVVALVGRPGMGRRITAISLLFRMTNRLSEVTLDPEYTGQLSAEPGQGYIINADDLDVPLTGRVQSSVARLLMEAREAGSYVVIRATPTAWQHMCLPSQFRPVRIHPPAALQVFRSHLLESVGLEEEADRWAGHPDVARLLEQASPADAARMARIAAETLSRRAEIEGDPVVVGLDAYGDWADQLSSWFNKGLVSGPLAEGQRRALLIAAAVLEGAGPGDVLTAARTLEKKLELEKEAGHGLAGPGAGERMREIGASLDGDSVQFTRPAYANSVVHYVWKHWPQVHDDLHEWLTSLPGWLRKEDAQRIAEIVVELAAHQRNASIVTEAAERWAHRPAAGPQGSRPSPQLRVAVSALTLAALNPEIGGAVRRKLYEWSRGRDPGQHDAVIDVCGDIGLRMPQIALTRLKHVVTYGSTETLKRSAFAVAQLGEEERLRQTVLSEIIAWLKDADSDRHRAAARLAFLGLADAVDPDGRPVLITDPVPGARRQQVLADGWREVLRSDDRLQAAAVVAKWLDAAIGTAGSRQIVVTIFGKACRSKIDFSNLAFVVIWGPDGNGITPDDRRRLFENLLRAIAVSADDPEAPSPPGSLSEEEASNDAFND
jgi:hypothetical protein